MNTKEHVKIVLYDEFFHTNLDSIEGIDIDEITRCRKQNNEHCRERIKILQEILKEEIAVQQSDPKCTAMG